MRFANILMAYFLIGAVMWGGGVIAWDNSGIGQLFVTSPGDDGVGVNSQTASDIQNSGGAISAISGTLNGGLILVWNILVKLIGYMFWPVIVLQSVQAPTRLVVVGGGGLTVAFFGALIQVIR